MGEFWLVAGTWGGKLVLYTEPNEDNNYQITAKCRIGHRGDVLVVESDINNIVSGGIDGMITVWNQFSGVRKFAFPLPDPLQEDQPNSKLTSVQSHIRKKISDVMFDPIFSNLVYVMQDSGNVHVVDISNGSIVSDYIAFMKVNSSWALSSKKGRVFVVGEMGMAALFDITLPSGVLEQIQKGKQHTT